MAKFTRNLSTVREHLDREALIRICEMDELEFAGLYDMEVVEMPEVPGDENFYFFKNNGSKVLAVAHLDTVVYPDQRTTKILDVPHEGPVVHSGALDDRLGAYIILDLLPKCGITYDILLTVGEESGCSTAEYFDADKDYEWIIEFDRGGMDVVLYEYECDELFAAVRRTGAQVGRGIFSDISYMEHVGVKGINWGVAYHDYHSTRGYAFLEDTMEMVARYLKFHQQNYGQGQMVHVEKPSRWAGSWNRRGRSATYSERNWWNEPSGDATDDSNWVEDKDGIFRWDPDLADYERERARELSPNGYPDAPDDYYAEGIYTDDEYIENPTLEQIQAALERADELAYEDYLREQCNPENLGEVG